MPVRKLKDFLDQNKIKYTIISHSEKYTTQEIAAVTHISGKEIAKTVMVKLDGIMSMVVLPASCRIDFELLKEASGAKEAELAGESEFKNLFPECDVGAMPPFGNLYGLNVYSARKLTEDEEIVFNAGSHTELIKMAYRDFEQLANPKVIRFSCQ